MAAQASVLPRLRHHPGPNPASPDGQKGQNHGQINQGLYLPAFDDHDIMDATEDHRGIDQPV
jgi:hypothetical protein